MSDPRPIYDQQAELAVLGCLIDDGAILKKNIDSLAATDFFVPDHQRLFDEILKIHDRGEPITLQRILSKENGTVVSEAIAQAVVPNFSSYLTIIRRDVLRRQAVADADEAKRVAFEEPEKFKPEKPFLLDTRKFDLLAPPSPARSIYGIGKATIATPGNLCVIAAQAKAGKSALVGAFIAATMGCDGDTLGMASSNSDGLALIHFDTEQSPSDHHALVATALRRVALKAQPSWLRSYRLADISTKDRFQLLEHELERARQDHGGIHSVLLDGVADLVADPNDSAEAFGMVERLHALAVTYDTSIVCVLHFNPGSEFNKTRGHLGSQLERKAETNLALGKADGVTVVYTKMARHAHIEKDAGARFQWDDGAGMHLSCGSAPRAEMPTKYTVQNLIVKGQQIAKEALGSKANAEKKIGIQKAKGFISELIGDGIFKVIEKPRPRTNPAIFLERVI